MRTLPSSELTSDRISTREELNQVLAVLLNADQRRYIAGGWCDVDMEVKTAVAATFAEDEVLEDSADQMDAISPITEILSNCPHVN